MSINYCSVNQPLATLVNHVNGNTSAVTRMTVLLEYIDPIFSEMTETVTEMAGRSLTAPSTMAGAISGTNHIHNTAN